MPQDLLQLQEVSEHEGLTHCTVPVHKSFKAQSDPYTKNKTSGKSHTEAHWAQIRLAAAGSIYGPEGCKARNMPWAHPDWNDALALSVGLLPTLTTCPWWETRGQTHSQGVHPQMGV